MDQGLKRLPLLAVLLIFWRCAFGFPGGVYSKTHLQWGRASGRSFAPRAVQSSQSESPVTGSVSVDEVGSSLIADRSQKSRSKFSNLRQYVKGGFSSSHETSRTQTGSVSAAVAVPQDERQTSSLTPLQPQVSSSSSVQNIASQLASGQRFQNQHSFPSHGGSGLQLGGGFSQIVSHQREGSTSGLLSSPGVPSLHTPESYVKLSSSPLMVFSQATTDQSSPSLHISSTVKSSGPLLGVSGSASSSSGDVLLQSPSTSSQYATGASTGNLFRHPLLLTKDLSASMFSGYESSIPLQSSGAAVHMYPTESLSSSPSIDTEGSTFTSKGSPIAEQVLSSGPVIITTQEVSSGSIGSPSPSISSQYSPGSLTPNKLGSLSLGVSSQSTSNQRLYMSSAPTRSVLPLASSSHYVPVQTGSSSWNLSSPKPQGTSAVYAPSSPSKYLNVAASSPQSVSFQSASKQDFRWPVAQVATQAGASSQFMSSQGGSGSYSGALSQPQSSPSKYSTGALKPTSTQTVSRPLTSVGSSHGSSGALGASSLSASQGSGSSFSGSAQAPGTFGQPNHGSPTLSKFSSSHQIYSQSTSDADLYGQLSATSQFGSRPEKGPSAQHSQAASGFNSGSLTQSQGSLGQYYPASPSKYVNSPLKSKDLTSQGSGSRFSGSAQAPSTIIQPAHSSPTFSKFSSSPQMYSQSTSGAGLYGQLSATSQFASRPQKGPSAQHSQAASGFNSGSLPQSQGSLDQYYPASTSKHVNAPLASQGLASQGSGSIFSGSAQAPGTIIQPAHSSPTFSKFSSSPQMYSQSTSGAGLYGQLSATSQFASRPQKGPSAQHSQAASGFNSGSLPQSQGSFGQYFPESPSKYVNAPMASQDLFSHPLVVTKDLSASMLSGYESSVPLQSSGAAVHVYSPESLSSSPSIDTKDSFTSKGSPIAEQVISSGPIITTQQVSSGSIGSQSPSTSSLYSPGSLTPSKRGSLSLWDSRQSTSNQRHYMSSAPTKSVLPLASSIHYVPVQTGSSSRNLYSPKPQGTSAVYAPSSPSKYLNVAASSPQSVSIQSGSKQDFRWPVAQVATQAGASSRFMSSQGGSGSYSGALSRPPSSPSKYSTGALKPTSTQTVSRPLTNVGSAHGNSGAPFGASSQSSSQASGISFSGSAQAPVKLSPPAHGSPTFSKVSSTQVDSQSTSDADLRSLTVDYAHFGSRPQKGPSQASSGFNSGSLTQSQGFLGQYYPASPSKYVNAPLESKDLTSQGSGSRFGGSAQAPGTIIQAAHSSPFSKFSSSQGDSQLTSGADLYGQLSATSQFASRPQKGLSAQHSQAASCFNSGSLTQSQGSLGKYYPASPSKHVNTPLASQGLASQGSGSIFSGSAQAPGSIIQPAHSSPTFSKFSSSQVDSQSTSDADLYGQLLATSQFASRPQKGPSAQNSQAASDFNSGSLPQSQGSLGKYYPASPSKHVNSPLASQGFATQSAVASSRRGLPSTLLVGSQSGSSLTLQGSGSSMPEGARSQFVSGSPSQYSSTSFSSTQTVAGQYSLGSSLGSSQSATGQSSSLYGSNPKSGYGAQLSSNRYASLKRGSSAVGGSSQYAPVVSPLDAKAALYLSRLSAASLTQGIKTSDTASSQRNSRAKMSSGFSSSLSALSQNVAPVSPSGPTSAVWRNQSPLGGVQRPSRLSFQAPSDSTISGQLSEHFASQNAADSSFPPSSGLSTQQKIYRSSG